MANHIGAFLAGFGVGAILYYAIKGFLED